MFCKYCGKNIYELEKCPFCGNNEAVQEKTDAVKEEIEADEPSVIIAQRPCALLKSVKYGAPVIIDTEKCRKCICHKEF